LVPTTVMVSFEPLFATVTLTAVEDPLQPARIVVGDMASENVYVMTSPVPIRPAVDPPFVAWMSLAVGAVVSYTYA
jgi:hypothetical protein